ncbi:MAG: anti-phage-associated DUF3780 domain-containing protein [Mariprofundaceae bacterium]
MRSNLAMNTSSSDKAASGKPILQSGQAKYAHSTLGFGVPATSDPHHFQVIIPKANSGKVQISEFLGLQAHSDDFSVIDRVLLERNHWTAIRSEIQRAFNIRLKEHNLQTASWKVGENPVDRLLGKELCVLAWAVEYMEMEKIPVAVRNWLALRPEERWWLFGMAAMSTGGIGDGNKGWRLALRHALGDVAQNEMLKPHTVKRQSQSTLPLLDLFNEG